MNPAPLVLFGGTLVLAVALGLYLTPILRAAAVRYGVLDRPDGDLKSHASPVPYLGGISVYVSFLASVALVTPIEPRLTGLLLGGTMMAMLGLFDDLRVLTPGIKLGGQMLAAWVVWRSGVRVELLMFPGVLGDLITIVWLVGVTNAFNILDVSDGLATGVGAIAGCGLFVVAIQRGDVAVAIATLALIGALLGFLRYNRAPASIYLGDAGSLFVGFMLAGLSMIGEYTRWSAWGAVAPLFILVVPLFDTVLVSLARMSRGLSPLRGSNDHVATRLRLRGWGAPAIARVCYGGGAVGAAAGVVISGVGAHTARGLILTMVGALLAVLVLLWRAVPPHALVARRKTSS